VGAAQGARTDPQAPLIRIGRIGRPHGVHGELTLEGSALTPLELLGIREFVWRDRAGATRALRLATARPAHTRLLVRFDHVSGRDQAAGLTNGELLIPRERLPDPGPEAAYTFQLIGLRVETEEGRRLGELRDIVHTGAHPIYVVRGERELLVPAAPGVLKRVSLAEGVIVVALPAGLEEL
jgi:16S rRNA processing protein RimM